MIKNIINQNLLIWLIFLFLVTDILLKSFYYKSIERDLFV
jgi:hypothetical protein